MRPHSSHSAPQQASQRQGDAGKPNGALAYLRLCQYQLCLPLRAGADVNVQAAQIVITRVHRGGKRQRSSELVQGCKGSGGNYGRARGGGGGALRCRRHHACRPAGQCGHRFEVPTMPSGGIRVCRTFWRAWKNSMCDGQPPNPPPTAPPSPIWHMGPDGRPPPNAPKRARLTPMGHGQSTGAQNNLEE